VNPANHWLFISLIVKDLTLGKTTGVVLEKLSKNYLDTPLLIEALMFIIACASFKLK
jgi:hypothetical protein